MTDMKTYLSGPRGRLSPRTFSARRTIQELRLSDKREILKDVPVVIPPVMPDINDFPPLPIEPNIEDFPPLEPDDSFPLPVNDPRIDNLEREIAALRSSIDLIQGDEQEVPESNWTPQWLNYPSTGNYTGPFALAERSSGFITITEGKITSSGGVYQWSDNNVAVATDDYLVLTITINTITNIISNVVLSAEANIGSIVSTSAVRKIAVGRKTEFGRIQYVFGDLFLDPIPAIVPTTPLPVGAAIVNTFTAPSMPDWGVIDKSDIIDSFETDFETDATAISVASDGITVTDRGIYDVRAFVRPANGPSDLGDSYRVIFYVNGMHYTPYFELGGMSRTASSIAVFMQLEAGSKVEMGIAVDLGSSTGRTNNVSVARFQVALHTSVLLANHNGDILGFDPATGDSVTLTFTNGVAGTFTGTVAGLDPVTNATLDVDFVNGLITNVSDGEEVIYWIDDMNKQVRCTVNSGVLQSANW